MLSADQIERFRAQGFLNCGRVVDEDTVRALRRRLDAVMEGRAQKAPEALRNMTGQDNNVVVQIVNIWQADDLFREHLYNARICEMACDLIGDDVLRVWHDQVQYKPARVGGPTTWHQDHPYWPIIQPADLVSAWMALEDATIENGCMRMVPRSHLWGPHKGGTIGTNEDFSPGYDPALVPPGETIEIIPCEVKAGEVMFHHCLTWHGSPPNRSERGRPAIAVHYMPGYTRYVPSGSHLVEHNVTVQPGEILQGEHFPTVWDRGPVPH
ncbi:MAG TPA: phytanoyl-CoA dioxygenase family protein [Armatimonadota bacterium]|nr:phytanoyl-CoA dioxygenase family protein [Armatimonadota bacterium]